LREFEELARESGIGTVAAEGDALEAEAAGEAAGADEERMAEGDDAIPTAPEVPN
jgi:hypothetical protein